MTTIVLMKTEEITRYKLPAPPPSKHQILTDLVAFPLKTKTQQKLKPRTSNTCFLTGMHTIQLFPLEKATTGTNLLKYCQLTPLDTLQLWICT